MGICEIYLLFQIRSDLIIHSRASEQQYLRFSSSGDLLTLLPLHKHVNGVDLLA